MADALQPSFVKGLSSLKGRLGTGSFADFIVEGARIGYDLDFDPASNEIRIDFREPNFICDNIAKDVCRFSSSAFLTIGNIKAELECSEKLAWGLIKLYYAAFYVGHSILRIVGHTCSNIDGIHIAQIKRLGSALGNLPPEPLETGLYHCVLNNLQTGVSLVRARGRVGGAHETFWKIFGEHISGLSEHVLLGHLTPIEARSAYLQLSKFQEILSYKGSNSSNWLSSIRNEIQYRHGIGVWKPSSVNKNSRQSLARLVDQCRRDPVDIDLERTTSGDLGKFVVGCVFSISLCETLLRRISERSFVGSKSFANDPLSMRGWLANG